MQCIRGQDDYSCGGTANRLKSFLYLLREAYETKRILLIYWTMPFKLEEYLVPPRGGINWRVPKWMEEVVSIGIYNIILLKELWGVVDRHCFCHSLYKPNMLS